MSQYITWNGANPTTAALSPVTTGTAIKTLLQLSTPSTRDIKIKAWGITFDGSPSAIKTELVQTDVAATVTAAVAAGINPWEDPNAPASLLTLGTANTGYTASAEGTTTVTRLLDYQLLSANNYVREFADGREPKIPVSKFLRIRVTAAAAVNAACFVIWEE